MDVGFMGWFNGLEDGKWMSQGCQLIRKRPLVNLEFYELNQKQLQGRKKVVRFTNAVIMKRKVFNPFRATFEISESPHPPATTPRADCRLPGKPGFHNQTRFGQVDL